MRGIDADFDESNMDEDYSEYDDGYYAEPAALVTECAATQLQA